MGLMVVTLGLAGAGCGGDDDPPAAAEATPTPGELREEEGVPGPLPARAESSGEVNATIQVGQEIFLTDEGPAPGQLIAKVEASILFVNETDEDLRVHFTNIEMRDIRIDAGDSAKYTPRDHGSLAYEVRGGDEKQQGRIQVEPYGEVGEFED